MKSGIYKIRNLVNGNEYIGSSSKLNLRKNYHWRELRVGKHHNNHLQKAWSKYGEKSFVFSIIYACNNNLLEKEQFFIDYFKPKYNIRKIASSNKGLSPSTETRKKLSISISKTHRRKFGTPIVQIDLNNNKVNRFDSIAQASEITGAKLGNIFKVLKGQNKTAINYVFVYEKDYDLLKNYIPIPPQLGKSHQKPINMYDKDMNFIKRFDSIDSASKMMKIHRSGIANTLVNRAKTAGGYIWQLVK